MNQKRQVPKLRHQRLLSRYQLLMWVFLKLFLLAAGIIIGLMLSGCASASLTYDEWLNMEVDPNAPLTATSLTRAEIAPHYCNNCIDCIYDRALQLYGLNLYVR